MKTIPKTFTTRGFDHALVERSKNSAIYSQTRRASGQILAYEVFRVRVATKERVHPQSGVSTLPGDETLCGESLWGKNGWTLRSLDAARTKCLEIDFKASAADGI